MIILVFFMIGVPIGVVLSELLFEAYTSYKERNDTLDIRCCEHLIGTHGTTNGK